MKFSKKNHIKYHTFFLIIISFVLTISSQNLVAQNAKKNKVRIKAHYVKIMDGEIYIDISATSKIKKKNVKVSNIKLILFNEYGKERTKIGTATTNKKGKSKFVINGLNAIQADSTDTYNIKLLFKGNASYKKASKSIHFKNADIQAELMIKDSTNYIAATLKDHNTNKPIVEEPLNVQVQRLFNPLRIGEEFNNTDENGTIVVPVEEGIPGIDGNLIIEVVLNDHDDYGTVKALVHAPIGVPIVEESTFDQRTMWSSRNKTPIFLLIFPNIVIIGIWAIIIYLIINLFKISKSKINKNENI